MKEMARSLRRLTNKLSSSASLSLVLGSALVLVAACTADDPELDVGDDAIAADAGSDGSPSSSDGGPSASNDAGQRPAENGADADAGPKVCTPSMPFLTVTALGGTAIASTVLEESPRLSKDELRMYFTRRSFVGDTNAVTYVATRASRTADFENPTALPELNGQIGNGGGGTSGAALTSDGLRLVFASTRSNNYADDLFIATRANAGVAFGAPAALDQVNVVNTSTNDATPFLVGDDLWFSSDRPGGIGQADLYVATWNGNTYASASAVAGLNTNAREFAPVLNDAETVMYFASDRGGAGTLGNADIFVATRPTATDAWGTPAPVPSASSAGNDAPGWISDDGCRLYFWADRVGNDVNLWVAER